ncbi:class I SAM-dependent methyltransferase [Nakamurella aerolata]|uniref:Methyltransferase domain-containing protein n=1 Tax=Nakamurella aerolata TaxID=1656892 RepID=A0A849A5M1_9ACTN|nr:methyltransferase domain-containing protein [Nakamurella aerolata]NNG36284.1 methyltransferase domain-containing protein [Nakamurella aerolata]
MSTSPSSPAETATDSADYSALYYHDYSGPPYTYEEPHWKNFFGGIADQIIQLFAPASAYDAGCAKGFLVRALLERGVDAYGGDISQEAIEGAPPGLRERLAVVDLSRPLESDRRYDLVTCIEVLEHMAPEHARRAVDNLCAMSDVVLLSTTPDDFREPTHVNIHQAGDWAQAFASNGFFRRTDIDGTFLSPWAVVFAKQQVTLPTLAHRYESVLESTTREVYEKRQALLDLRRQLDEASAPAMVARDELQEQYNDVVHQRNTIAAERDALITERDDAAAELARFNGPEATQARWALVDELLGARAELAQQKVQADTAVRNAGAEAVRLRAVVDSKDAELQRLHAELAVQRGRAEAAEADASAARTSTTWRAGRLATAPLRLARRALRR